MDGCGDEGKFEPDVTECLREPPTPARRAPEEGFVEGEVSCGGDVTAQILRVRSAEPVARRVRSVDRGVVRMLGLLGGEEDGMLVVELLEGMKEEAELTLAVPRTQTAQIASVWPSSVAFGSTRPRSQTRTVASCPPEKIQPSPVTRPPVEKAEEAGQAARDVTMPSWPRCVKYAWISESGVACNAD